MSALNFVTFPKTTIYHHADRDDPATLCGTAIWNHRGYIHPDHVTESRMRFHRKRLCRRCQRVLEKRGAALRSDA